MLEHMIKLRQQAQETGLFLPLNVETEALGLAGELHGIKLKNRRVLLMQQGNDADAQGAPTAETLARYDAAVREQAYSIVVLEPAAISLAARSTEQSLVMQEDNTEALATLIAAIRTASEEVFGITPVIVALLDHAGVQALESVTTEQRESLPETTHLLTDDELTTLVAVCADSAKAAELAGCNGIALNAAERSLFGESLAAFHREGKFGGDFDNRTRFVRDCYTAMKLCISRRLFFTIRLSMSDGIPQPDGWGMAFEDESAPDLSEPALLLTVLRALYSVELVLCSVGIPGMNWMDAAEPESDLIRCSRLCTCVAMLDSDRQQNVQLVLPEIVSEEIPFANLAAGMIAGEFAAFGGFLA